MDWQDDYSFPMTRARLAAASPEEVCRALRMRAEWVINEWKPVTADHELDEILYKRDDALINIGLAEHGLNLKVVASLYASSFAKGLDPIYAHGLRVACLSNRVAYSFDSNDIAAVVGGDEALADIIKRDDRAELKALFTNALSGRVLSDLYRRKGLFAALSESEANKLVWYSTGNRLLVSDSQRDVAVDGTEVIQAFMDLLRSAPPTDYWIYTLHDVILKLDPEAFHIFRSQGIDDIIDRWKDVVVHDVNGRDSDPQPERGWLASGITLVEEFCCLISALFGHSCDGGRPTIFGSADDPSLYRRCAYYAVAQMKLDEVQAAADKDGDVFGLAASLNDDMYRSIEKRALLEEVVYFGALGFVYNRRIERLRRSQAERQLTRVHDEVKQVFKERDEAERRKTDAQRLERLEAGMAFVAESLKALRSTGIVAIIALAALIWWTR